MWNFLTQVRTKAVVVSCFASFQFALSDAHERLDAMIISFFGMIKNRKKKVERREMRSEIAKTVDLPMLDEAVVIVVTRIDKFSSV